jgi:hypothetical protein
MQAQTRRIGGPHRIVAVGPRAAGLSGVMSGLLALTAALVWAGCSASPRTVERFVDGGTTGEGPGFGAADAKGADADAAADDGETTTGQAGPLADFCVPGAARCASPTERSVCAWDGLGAIRTPCPSGEACTGGTCQAVACDPNTSLEHCADDRRLEVCDGAGSGVIYRFCDESAPVCFQGTCQALACAPNARVCAGLTVVKQCNAEGTTLVSIETCGPGTYCRQGRCEPKCTSDFKDNTYLGCEYWLADLDNVEGGAEKPVAAVVSNPSATSPTNVVLSATDDAMPPVTAVVPPLGSATLTLPTGFDLDGSSLGRRSFLIASDSAVTVHAFNPLQAAGVFSTDATLLLPAHAVGRAYVAMSWPQRQADAVTGYIPVRGFLTLIATEFGGTQVRLFATADLEPSATTPAIARGTVYDTVLHRGDVLNLETGGGLSGPDLTGTLVIADKRLAVFSGHECANVPLVFEGDQVVGTNYCDHIEQQLFPVEVLGSEYVADAFAARGPADHGLWRVTAATTGVTVTTDPPGIFGAKTLAVGEFLEASASESFVLRASGPVLVGHFALGSNYEGFVPDPLCAKDGTDSGVGDPAMALAVPTKQFRKDHVVLSPDGYRLSYLNLIHPAGVLVEVDGAPVAESQTAVGTSAWRVTTLTVGTGVHRIEAEQPIGVTVYGYDCDVSYAYPGGVDLEAGR